MWSNERIEGWTNPTARYNTPVTTKRWMIGSGLLVLSLGVLLYGGTLRNEFVELDDTLLITQNPAAQALTWTNVKTVFSSYDPELYIPLTFLSYQIDATLGGLDPFIFHLTNLLLHILNAWLILILAYTLTRKRWPALVASLLFLIHPINTEAVLWASGRKDLLSTTFFLLSAILYLLYLRTHGKSFYAGSLAGFLLGLLSKVTVISLAPALFVIDWLEGKKITRRSLLEKIPFFILAVIFGIVALYGKSGAPHLSLITRILVAAKSLTFAIGKILVPTGLSPMYGYAGTVTITSSDFLISILIVTMIILAAFVMRHRWKTFAFGTAFIMLTYAPSFSNLIKNGDYYLTSDRYSYIPSIAIFMLAALGLEKIGQLLQKQTSPENAGKFINVFMGILLIILAFMTIHQTRIWTDSETLSRYVTQVSPEARLGHMWYGNALRDAGKIDQALAEYETALAAKDDPQVRYNRALALEATDRIQDATDDYQKAIVLDPAYALAHINLGRLYYTSGKKTEARKEFEAAAASAPDLAMPFFNLGVLDGEEKKFESAAEFYRKALERDPNLSDARANLAIALLQLGKMAEAVEELKETLRRDPENPTAQGVLEQLIEQGIVKEGT